MNSRNLRLMAGAAIAAMALTMTTVTPAVAQSDDWAKAAVGTAQAKDGLMRVFVDNKANRIMVRLPPAGADGVMARYLYQPGLTSGLGSAGIDRAENGNTQVVVFRRAGKKIILQAENYDFRAVGAPAEEVTAVRKSFAVSNMWSGDVAAEGPDGSVVVDLTSFLTSDIMDVSSSLRSRRNGNFRLSPNLSYADAGHVGVFPENLEFEAVQTFTADDPGPDVRAVAPDPRNVTLTVHHSFIKLPEPGFKVRPHDPRTGTSVQVLYTDFATPLDAPMVYRLARRFRLEKVDPTAARSRVKKPIVYYVDRAAPEQIRNALIEGAGWWNQAFEAAGFIDAFRVEALPIGVDPMDVRYNIVNWVHRQTRGFSTGATIIDPRTGEIVRGIVQLESLRVRQDRIIFEGLVGADASGKGGPNDPVQAALARIRQLGMHETGHTLGFSHNFAGSTNGRASALDYPGPLVKVRDGKIDLSDAYAKGAGAWDKYTVKWLYTEFAPGVDEKAALDKIAREPAEQGLRFIADTEHPASSQWDNGPDPVADLENMMNVRDIALSNFGLRNIPKGAPVADLRRVFVPIYLFHRYAVDAVAKQIGGVDYRYAVNGEGREASTIIDAAAQRRALAALLKTLDPAKLDTRDDLAALLSQDMSGNADRQYTIELFDTLGGPVFDAVGAAIVASDLAISQLFEAPRMNRVEEQFRKDPKQLSLNEVLRAAFAQVAAKPGEAPRLAEIRRRQQARMIGALAQMLADKKLTPTAGVTVETALTEAGKTVEASAAAGDAGAYERNLARLLARGDRGALTRFATDIAPSPKIPPGTPIEDCWFCLPERVSADGTPAIDPYAKWRD